MEQILTLGADGVEYTMVIIFAGLIFFFGIILVLVCIPAFVSLRSRREREQTKREIAAYVAEGSLTPQEGIEMLKAVGAGDTLDTKDIQEFRQTKRPS